MSSMTFNDGGIIIPLGLLTGMLILCFIVLYNMIVKPRDGDE